MDNNEDSNNEQSIEDLLDDDQIREFFESRDPNREKPSPFLTEEAEEQYSGRASKLKTVSEDTEEEEVYGISYTQHQKHIRQVAFRFTWVGMCLGLLTSILLYSIL